MHKLVFIGMFACNWLEPFPDLSCPYGLPPMVVSIEANHFWLDHQTVKSLRRKRQRKRQLQLLRSHRSHGHRPRSVRFYAVLHGFTLDFRAVSMGINGAMGYLAFKGPAMVNRV